MSDDIANHYRCITMYPQGCDSPNYLSLFLCIANHEELLPGWNHLAQFTVGIINRDPAKNKYSDTLHRFQNKEHDWGWKKFTELSKLSNGFVDDDTLRIRAQVQVIRVRADRPFRCLNRHYRRELLEVYMTNVEQICKRFAQEKRRELGKLLDDKPMWSRFCEFWSRIDKNSRSRMSKETLDMVLKVLSKLFYHEKEVTTTLVMETLYNGLKALQGKYKGKLLDDAAAPVPMVTADERMFVLADDIVAVLEQAALEGISPRDVNDTLSCTKEDGNDKESMQRYEVQLTVIGRRTVEYFVLAYIFRNKVEVAFKEAIALKNQEELIREEEAKHGLAVKEKKPRKKQVRPTA